MAAPRLNKTDQGLAESFGFEFSTPPENAGTRTSKYDERFEAARTLCLKFPGQSLKVVSYDKPSQPYNMAKAINNGEHRSFKDDSANWTAVARKEEVIDPESEETVEQWSVWLTYNGEKPTE